MCRKTRLLVGIVLVLSVPLVARGQTDPDTAAHATIDRFSATAGTLFIRTTENGFPGPNEPIDFDEEPFITQGFGPAGEVVRYYNFDVQSITPEEIYVLFREGENTPVEGQLNLVDAIPGDENYNDFWLVVRVIVPSDYIANTVTSVDTLMAREYSLEETDVIVNCPIVPAGSTARIRFREEEDPGLTRGWYRNQVVYYFNFSEASLLTSETGDVPVSPIYVTFNINPDQEGGGPASGFVTEPGTMQTHNVTATVPNDDTYSPLWSVNVYDNMDFAQVMDLNSALAADLLAGGVALVNCPIVSLTPANTAVEPLPGEVPDQFVLHGNYPNPFNPATTIRFDLDRSTLVELVVYNVMGQRIHELIRGELGPGRYETRWNGTDPYGRPVSSGIYFYRLSAGDRHLSRSMILVK